MFDPLRSPELEAKAEPPSCLGRVLELLGKGGGPGNGRFLDPVGSVTIELEVNGVGIAIGVIIGRRLLQDVLAKLPDAPGGVTTWEKSKRVHGGGLMGVRGSCVDLPPLVLAGELFKTGVNAPCLFIELRGQRAICDLLGPCACLIISRSIYQ